MREWRPKVKVQTLAFYTPVYDLEDFDDLVPVKGRGVGLGVFVFDRYFQSYELAELLDSYEHEKARELVRYYHHKRCQEYGLINHFVQSLEPEGTFEDYFTAKDGRIVCDE